MTVTQPVRRDRRLHGQLTDLRDQWRAGRDAWRRPGLHLLVPVLYLIAVAADSVTTGFVGYLPYLTEANPVVAAGMAALGSPQAFMVFAFAVLAPGAVLVAARPRGRTGFVVTWSLLGVAAVKGYLGVANAALICAVW